MAKPVLLLTTMILVLSAAMAVAACAGSSPAAPTAAPTGAVAATASTVALAPTVVPTVAAAPTTAPSPVAPTTAVSAPTPAASPAGTPEVENAGQELFEANCAACHGPDGAGGLRIGSATSADIRSARLATAYKNDNALISRAILNGKDEEGKDLDTAMPHWQGKLTDQQVSQIIAYLKTLK